MVRIVLWDMPEGNKQKEVGVFESIQVTENLVRDPDGNVILHYFAQDATWFDQTGNGWYDWTVEAV